MLYIAGEQLHRQLALGEPARVTNSLTPVIAVADAAALQKAGSPIRPRDLLLRAEARCFADTLRTFFGEIRVCNI